MYWWWFKKKEKPVEKCVHYKKFGEKVPLTMIEIVRFSPYAKDCTGYGIYECSECKTRAFACMQSHAMGQRECDMIDGFISHKIAWAAFKDFLDKKMAWVKVFEQEQERSDG